MKKLFQSVISVLLAAVLVCTAASGTLPTQSEASSESVSCNVKFSRPAICCDVGDMVNLAKCGVQFAMDEVMTTNGIKWTHNGRTVTTFTPSRRGVYTLTAKAGGVTKTVYIVAKDAHETEYVLYRNNFDAAPTDFRVLEASNGTSISVSDGNYIMDASGHPSAYGRVLLPAFLDDFGDATIKAAMKMEDAVDDTKWSSLIYRVQNGNFPFYQGCLTAADDVELAQRDPSYAWAVYGQAAFEHANEAAYNLLSVTVKGTRSVFKVNGYEVLSYDNTAYAAGAFGIHTRGTKLMVDYVEVSLDGNDPVYASGDVSYAKPAIRADLGDTIDLRSCDVQFAVDTLYTEGSSITWKLDGKTITTFTPTQAGITKLTATCDGTTKNIYVVTRNLDEGEYVLYRNDFNTAPDDFRVLQQTKAPMYHDGAGNFVIDASASSASGKVLLPAFLDEFGDFKLETRYKEISQSDSSSVSVMGRVQSGNDRYMQMGVRFDTAANGVHIAPSSRQAQTDEIECASYDRKSTGNYHVYTLTMQSNHARGYINGTEVVSCDNSLYVTGGMGLQAEGEKLIVDYVQVSMGTATAVQDSAVTCYVAKSRPAVGCNVGQTVLLSQCPVQFTYGAYAVDPSQITWTKDGQVITQFSNTTEGMHKVTATHGHTSMDIYIVVKKSTSTEFVLYDNDFSKSPTDFRVPEASNGGRAYPLSGSFVLNGSSSADSYVRVFLPSFLDQFGNADLEASIKLTAPTDNSKWGSIVYRSQTNTAPYMQCCWRYNSTASNGVEISQRLADNTWNVIDKASTTAHSAGGFNVMKVKTFHLRTVFYINNTEVLRITNTPYYDGRWGFQVRGLTMTIDYVRMGFTANDSSTTLYTIPGGYVDVRDPSTGINVAPALVTDVKTKADFDNILTDCPAVAIMNYDVVNGVPKVLFSDGAVTPDEALNKLGSKIIPAFRINDTTDADSLATFLNGRGQRDAYAVSSDLSVIKRAYSNWKYIRGVADYSSYTSFDPETIRYNALANGARVMILPESASRAAITQIQDSYGCVWLTVSAGKTASVAGTNKGPYGLVTPNRTVTETCYKTYYSANTLVRRTNVIGHRGNPSQAPENTILGTQTAYKNGANMVENDVYLTTDNVVMVMHDETLDRTTNGTGKVVEMTSAQVKKYVVDYYSGTAAQPIPTLEDYFKSIKDQPHQKLVIEMKHPANNSLAKGISDMIKKYDIMDQVVVISFIHNNLAYMSDNLPGVPVGLLTWQNLDETNPVYSTYETLENIQGYNSVFNPGSKGWGSAVIKELMYRGVTLWPWTINNQAEFDQLMMKGVGGITTDYSQYSSSLIESIHWNSASRVISSTYKSVLTDITNSCEVVVVEDTLGISCSAGNITVPSNKSGKASFYYRYKSTTPSGLSYYTVTEIRTIEQGQSPATLELISGSSLKLASSQLTNVTETHTVAAVKAQFKYAVAIQDKNGNALADNAIVTTGSTVYLTTDSTKRATIIMKGDVNGDGKVNTTDYVTIRGYLLKLTSLTGVYLTAADTDNDGKVNTTDYVRLKGHFLDQTNLYA